MADFDIAFSEGAERRYPTTDEKNNGFPCGPADQPLFNGLFYRLEAELREVITFAGITPTDDRFTQVREAIQALIAAAVGGGPAPDPETYVLMAQARARLPIFPEVTDAGNVIVVTSPGAGTVRVPGGATLMHRGIYSITTVLTDFATVASKTYHLRWRKATGFGLFDLADVAYNPTVSPETDPKFDSTFDDALIARVITNGANLATITNLANAHSLQLTGVETDPRGAYKGNTSETAGYQNNIGPYEVTNYDSIAINFARTPQVALWNTNDVRPSGMSDGNEFSIGVRPLSRYQLAVWGQGDRDIRVGWRAWL